MKQILLATLAAMSFSSAFAGTVETAEDRKMNCKLTLVIIDHAIPEDNYAEAVLFDRTFTALDVTRNGQVQLSMSDNVGYRTLISIRKTEGNKLTTTAVLEDLKTGVSTSAISTTKGDSQDVAGITATIYSTNKLAIFNDAKNHQLELDCK